MSWPLCNYGSIASHRMFMSLLNVLLWGLTVILLWLNLNIYVMTLLFCFIRWTIYYHTELNWINRTRLLSWSRDMWVYRGDWSLILVSCCLLYCKYGSCVIVKLTKIHSRLTAFCRFLYILDLELWQLISLCTHLFG